MYAVVKTGGKQYRVAEGDRLQVEHVGDAGADVDLDAVLLVDDGRVLATPSDLHGVRVTAKVVSEDRGPKVTGFTYKSKSNERRRWGHRQSLCTIEITGINEG